MQEYYSITQNGNPVGKMAVSVQGLYYRFTGRCTLSREEIFRVEVTCGDRRESLGVLVPSGEEFVVDTRLPVKQLGEGELRFTVAPKRQEITGQFVPILDEEPFAYITRLKESFLEVRNGQPGIRIP